MIKIKYVSRLTLSTRNSTECPGTRVNTLQTLNHELAENGNKGPGNFYMISPNCSVISERKLRNREYKLPVRHGPGWNLSRKEHSA